MRIRRRPPLPFSPPPLSQNPDLSSQLHPPKGREELRGGGGGEGEIGRRGVGLHPDGDLAVDPQPSDPHPMMEKAAPFIPNPSHLQGFKEEEELELDPLKPWEDAQVNNSNKRNGSSSGAKVSRFESEDSALPKKRGGVVEIGNDGVERKFKVKAKPKPITCSSATIALNNGSASVSTSLGSNTKRSDDGLEKEEGIGNGKKIRRSPAVLMEGSRCSRVNGRGWRCCQQTLVGYSLCEHHLGKGRLRSMNSVRGGQVSTSRKPKKSEEEGGSDEHVTMASMLEEEIKNNLEEGEEEKGVKKGKKKIGMVKARSISSLLDKTDQPPAAAMAFSSMPPPSHGLSS